MTKHLLVIEDARDMQLMLRSALEDKYTLTLGETIEEAERVLENGVFDLILLDVILPDGTGFDLCQKLKASARHKKIPVIFLTGQTDVSQRVRGLQLGAEDYILKPFAMPELMARIEAHLRRVESHNLAPTSFRVSSFHVDIAAQTAVLKKAGNPDITLNLTRIEFKILLHFLRNPGRVIPRVDLMKQVWGESTHVSEHTVDTHISSLRKKIGVQAGEIKAVIKQGYTYAPTN